MVRLTLLIILILFLVWILRPFLITRDRKKAKDKAKKIFDSDHNTLSQQNTILIIITAITLLALVVWLLPKFGINFFALLQKIVPLISSLRSILPF